MGFATGSIALGQSNTSDSQKNANASAAVGSHDSNKSTQFWKSKDIVGANVKDSSGTDLGDISELYLNPKNGQSFAVIKLEKGGGRQALVPLEALTVIPPRNTFAHTHVTIDKTRADIESAPTITNNQWEMLDDPNFTKSIYTHFVMPVPGAVGGASTPEGVSTGSGTSNPNGFPKLPRKLNQ
jgi:sporulation protein YlmC with PRC-barrel domain